jgi:very-short-patch-repair endonuclease
VRSSLFKGEVRWGMGFPMHGQTNKYVLDHKLQLTLRNNMTDAERKLWGVLRGKQFDGFKFRRQHPYEQYILDFACLEKKLIVEVDGGQHTEDTLRDSERTLFLGKAGFRVLRFWNHEVMAQMDAVRESIWRALHDNANPSPPSPPLEGEGNKQHFSLPQRGGEDKSINHRRKK